MRVVLQRVDRAEARLLANDEPVGEIGVGVVLYVGFAKDDTVETSTRMAHKVANLRIFEDGDSVFGRSLRDVAGEALVLAQFTVMGDTSRGRRPNFSPAAPPNRARALLDTFADALAAQVPVVRGPFAERLVVDVRNRGPFTLPLEL